MHILCLLALVLLFSCANEKAASVLNPDALTTQVYQINTTKDTILTTTNGAKIQIAAGSFSGGDGTVNLQVKEAYSIEDIVKAGLTTQSNGDVLRSDGMIYLDAVGNDITIIKPLGISLPTEEYQPGMQLFTGEVKDGAINWTNPKPLADTVPEHIVRGKALFDAQCATCHGLDKNLTGPALQDVESRGPWYDRKNLVMYVHNPAAFIPLSEYMKCLASTYNGQVMPSFPQLGEKDIYAIFDYIKYNDGGIQTESPIDLCIDSCRRYDSVMLAINKKRSNRDRLIADNGLMTEVHYQEQPNPPSVRQSNKSNEEDNNLVKMERNNAEYYKFSINAFGWYNIDDFLKKEDGLQETKLTVQLGGALKKHVDIYLVIPSLKLFTQAGRTDNDNEFAFYTRNGNVLLPHGVQAYLIAMSENEEGILFSQHAFTIAASQNIVLEVKPSTKEAVYTAFKKMDKENLSVKVEDTKNASSIRQLNEELNAEEHAAEVFRPKNCDCYCGHSTQQRDTTLAVK